MNPGNIWGVFLDKKTGEYVGAVFSPAQLPDRTEEGIRRTYFSSNIYYVKASSRLDAIENAKKMRLADIDSRRLEKLYGDKDFEDPPEEQELRIIKITYTPEKPQALSLGDRRRSEITSDGENFSHEKKNRRTS